jgi:uncharacterized membrane protein YfcA
VLGGAVGLVLGSLRLPAFILASGSAATAAGTNIAVSAASALTGGIAHARAGRVDWRIAAWMTPPSVLAAFLGGYFGGRIPETLLLAGIAAALLWNGVQLLFEFGAPPRARNPRLAAVVAGSVIGLIGGAVGLILGTLRMPALLGRVGLPAARAVGTNLVVGFFLGVAGFTTHALASGIDWWVLAAGLVGAIPGGWFGARATGRFSENALRLALGVVLVVVGIAFAIEAAVR